MVVLVLKGCSGLSEWLGDCGAGGAVGVVVIGLCFSCCVSWVPGGGSGVLCYVGYGSVFAGAEVG